MTQKLTKICAAGLAAALLGAYPASALAAGPALQKEEVVYGMLDATGTPVDVEVVNIFDGGEIVDYGNYSSVKVLNTNDPITLEGDTVTLTSGKEKVYYQGTLPEANLPWDISLGYTLDGKTVAPEALGGQSGKLVIHFVVGKNEACKTDFFESYALQATFVLDTAIAANITAKDATVANVGQNKQLTYTILPGKGLDTEITADVTDFEMPAVTVNGVRLNLDIEVDDASLLDKVNELMQATADLNEGAGTLLGGTGELAGGSGALVSGAQDVHSGVEALDTGMATLQGGVGAMQAALNTLNGRSGELAAGSAQMKEALAALQSSVNGISVSTEQIAQLVAASAELRQGADALGEGANSLQQALGYEQYKAVLAQNGLDVEALQAGNSQAIATLTAQVEALQGQLAQLEGAEGQEAQAEQVKGQIESLQAVIQLLTGDSAALAATQAYLDGAAGGAAALAEGASALKTNYASFDEGIGTLAAALQGMAAQLPALQEGVDALVNKYGELDGGITAYTGGVDEITASYRQIVDGVASLASGTKELLDGSGRLTSGAQELYDGVIALRSGTAELADGTGRLAGSTSDMDVQVEAQINEMLSSVKGGDGPVTSFVSEKNKNVTSVQFALKTAAIEKTAEAQKEPEHQPPQTFLQKLLALFGR